MPGVSNAVMAKSRALYGKRLVKQDYDELMNSRTINDVVSYLKTRTVYSASFESANSDMSSFQVEELLKIDVLKTFEKVSRYENAPGREYYGYYLKKSDIEQIMRFIHYLSVGRPQDYLEVLPPFFNKHSDIDLYRLASVRSYNEMLEVLENTAYYDALKPFADVFNDPRVYIKIENSLDKVLWEQEKKIVSRYKGRERKAIEEILTYRHDMENIVRIYRLRRFGVSQEVKISDYLDPYFTAFTKKEIEVLLNTNTAAELISAVSKTSYRKYFSSENFVSLEDFTQRAVYSKLRHEIRYNTDPIVVMLCYFFLKENEVDNIIHITEGIRSKASPEVISSVLIGTDC